MNTQFRFENQVEQFAIDELNRFYKGTKPVHLECNEQYEHDRFDIVNDQQHYTIYGGSSRALLYGVYRFLEKVQGILFLDLHQPQPIEAPGIQNKYEGIPKFKRRGNVFETIDDIPFLKNMLDVGTKNGLNEVFFTFFLWDEVKDALLPDIKKRGIDVTLGGHSLRYLLAKAKGFNVSGKSAAEGAVNDLVGEETEFTAQYAIKNHDFLQDEQAQQAVIDVIVTYCKAEPVIRRISLWPEDVGTKGEESSLFLSRYMSFTGKLRQGLKAANLNVDVEHIVYNAGLSWDMLERKNQPVSKTDVLYAYWGRDYTESYASERDARAWRSLVDWRQATNQQLTIFEYYSDHFMLSELFPLLFERIAIDIERYEEIGCEGILNLVVPLHKVTKAQPQMAHYDYQQYQQLNNIVFMRSLWRDVETVPYLIPTSMQRFVKEVEQLVGKHSVYNSRLFPSRVVDAKNPEMKQEVLLMLQKIDQRLNDAEVEAPLQHYVQALKQVVHVTKQRWEGL